MPPSDVANHLRVSSPHRLVDLQCDAGNSGRLFIAVKSEPGTPTRSQTETCPMYPRGSWLCVEGSVATGIFILHSGRAKETLSSADGKKLIVRVLGPGEFVGLASVLTGKNYESTVEALETTQAQFICADEFLQNMEHSGELRMGVVMQLGRNCMEVYRHLRRITFPVSITQRVASLVQEWSASSAPAKAGVPPRFKVVLTQEEIAQMVDSTRETVSRVLTHLRRKGWLTIRGVTWTVNNPRAMKELAEWGSPSRP